MNGVKLGLVSALAFLLPLGVVLYQQREAIGERFTIDPKTTKGRLLYFTLPAG